MQGATQQAARDAVEGSLLVDGALADVEQLLAGPAATEAVPAHSMPARCASASVPAIPQS